MKRYSELHDSTFMGITLIWDTGVVECTFRLGDGHDKLLRLTTECAQQVSCSRVFPWGRSVSVNEVVVEHLPDGLKVTIEMQSGDEICLLCERERLG